MAAVWRPLYLVLANLFLYYAFDLWMQRYHPDQPFKRYADDAVVHCRSLVAAQALTDALAQRFGDCGLALHPTKTVIVYCQDDDRREPCPESDSEGESGPCAWAWCCRPGRPATRRATLIVW
jgi:retron-type reverse transcriptase